MIISWGSAGNSASDTTTGAVAASLVGLASRIADIY
jgi:hypothetical protein